MTRLLVAASIRSRGLVLALAAGMILFGALQLRDMPRDALPEFGPTTVEVQTEALGLSAQEVEQLVTVPLEQDLLNGVAYLDTIRSESVPGLSRIEMIFERGTSEARARQVVNERLTQAFAIPAVSSPPQMLQPRSATGRVLMLRVSSQIRSLLELGILARWTLRPHLMGVDGVANVSIWGQREQQLQVQVDPVRLQQLGITLDQIIETTGNALWVSPLTFLPASTPGAGGFYDTATQRIGVEHAQPITSPEALAKVILEPGDSAAEVPEDAPPPRLPRLGEVANVVEDHQPLIGDAVFTDGGEGLLIVVEKLPEANTVEVTERLDSAIKGLAPGLEGVTIDTGFFRPADYVEDSTGALKSSLLFGAVLAALALGLLLYQVRTALVTAATVVVSMFAAIAVVALRGETLNVMVLAGLVLALVVVVDDAVNAAFNTARIVDRDSNGESLASRFGAAALIGARPITYAAVILLVAITPFLVLSGEGRAFIPPVLLTYAAAAIVSFFVAVTVSPALSMVALFRSPRENRQSPALAWLKPHYERTIGHLRTRPRRGMAVLGLALLLGLVALPFVQRGRSVVPELKDEDVLVHLEAAPGTSLTEMRRISARIGAELSTLKDVDQVGGHVGRAILGDQAVNVNEGEIWVRVEDDRDYSAAVRSIEDVVNGYPGIDAVVTTYGRARINSVLDATDGVEGKDLTVRTFGYEQEELARQATAVQEAVGKIEGVKDPILQLPTVQPTLEVEVDLDRAQALGVKPGDVRRAAATLISGLVVGNLFEDQKVFEVMVRGTEDIRNSLTSVQGLLINPPTGGPAVRLDSVANVRIVPSPKVIRHASVSRYVDLGFDVDGRDVGAVAKDVKETLLGLSHPLEYHAELLPEYKDRGSSRTTVVVVALLAAIGVFLILQAATGSWRMAPATLLVILGSVGGGLLFAAIAREKVTVGLLAGLVAVGTLATRQTIAFIHRCHGLEDIGAEPGAAVERVVDERFPPTLTSTAMLVGLMLPLALFSGRMGHEVVGPMAIVVIGGVLTSAVLVLLALPVLYERYGARSTESRERIELFANPIPIDAAPAEVRTPDHRPVDVEA